ncbi:MAG: FmdB family zinc ribbon protein [Acidimicrobiales bacterium]
MPLYAFACGQCGPFDLRRPASQVGEPAGCPTCQGVGTRIFTPPGVALLTEAARTGRDMEARSAHEPDVVGQPRGAPLRRARTSTPPWAIGH